MSTTICMWSGPRTLSAAMMRSFGARADTAVWDEPFFAPFLAATGAHHPGREETLAAHETDADVVAEKCLDDAPDGKRYFFQKHMAHHMLDGFPLDWAEDAKHFFLIRHPRRVIASYARERASFTTEDLGYAPLRRLHATLTDLTGDDLPVIESDDILENPNDMLKKLCQAINIKYDSKMLSWKPGPRSTDGAWAPHWYERVNESTGFGDPPGGLPGVGREYENDLSACFEDYQALRKLRLT